MRRSTKMRITLVLALATFASSSFAEADPLSDLQRLLFPVMDVRATGYSPTKVLVSWTDRSAVETSFRIEMAVEDERGTYKPVGFAPKCENGALSPTTDGNLVLPKKCSSTIDFSRRLTEFGLVAADTRPLFFRVVPLLELADDISKPTPGNGTPLFEGMASPVDPALLGPLAPTDFLCNGGGAEACTNVTSVTLTWTDNSDEAYFWIFRARGAGNVDFGTKPHALVAQNVSTFHEDLDDFGKVFTYKVTAVREQDIERADGSFGQPGEPTEFSYTDSADVPTGATNTSPPVVIIVPVAPVPAPTDPTGLTAVFVAPGTDTRCPSSKQGCTRLTWIDSAIVGKPYIDEDGWFIEIGDTSNGPDFRSQWTAPSTPGPGTRTWYDVSMTPDTKRCYRVRAWRLGPAYSNYTNPVCLGALPKAPTNLTATPLSNAAVDLTWKDNSTTEESFLVQRRCNLGQCTSPVGSWEDIAELDLNTEAFRDENVMSLTGYSYRVFAVNSTGRSASSNIATITTLQAPLPKPKNLVAVGRSHAILLTWDDMATTETGYRVEYSHTRSCSIAPSGEWTTLVDLPANAQGHLDTDGLGVKQSRWYRVRAVKGQGVSDPSNEACATTLEKQLPNGAPKDIEAITQSNTSIVLKWTDTASNETAFRIEYAVGTNSHCGAVSPMAAQFKLYKNVTPLDGENRPFDMNSTGTRTWLVEGLTPHSGYLFRVKAINPDGESEWGTRAGVSTPTGDPLEVISACAQTYGPPRPIFIDPHEDNQINATRCNFTVNAVRLEANNTTPHHDRVGGLRVHIIAYIPGSSIAHTDTLFVIAKNGTVPGATANANKSQYILNETSTPNNVKDGEFVFDSQNKNNWRIPYRFLRGFNYKLLVTAYLEAAAQPPAPAGTHWASVQNHVTDTKVLADCAIPNTNTP